MPTAGSATTTERVHVREEGVPVVAFDDVSKRYAGQDHDAVQGLELAIREGEFFSLLGASGSGKTTTLRMIAGFERPTTGRVLLDGVDVTGVPANRRDVSTVFQNYALFPHLTVRRNVEYPLRMRRVPRDELGRRVDEALARVDLGAEFARRLPHELSGGQRQRVALARALVSRPKLVLLDEPLGALDLKLRQQMQVVLKHLQREVGLTFIYVTHDQGEALAMSDSIAVMDQGRVVQRGTPYEVYYQPATPFVAEFIGRSNLMDVVLEATASGTIAVAPGGARLPVASTSRSGPAKLAIRYECVRVLPRGEDGLDGIVEEVAFLGDGQEVGVRVGATRIVGRVAVDRTTPLAPGDPVRVAIAPSDVTVLDG